jgi:hypothetical protein
MLATELMNDFLEFNNSIVGSFSTILMNKVGGEKKAPKCLLNIYQPFDHYVNALSH